MRNKINIKMIDENNKMFILSAGGFMELTERLKYLLAAEGLKQKDLADRLNTSSQTVNNWLKRNAISRDAAQQISEIYGYSLDWLLNGVGNPKLVVGENQIPDEKDFFPIRTWDSKTPLDNDEVEIPFLKDIEFACGNGSYSEDDYNGFKLRFSKSTMRKIGANSDGTGVIGFPARGDSMEPVISNGTTVAVNTSDKKIVDGKIYAINQGGLKRIKLLHQTSANKIIIRSYNKIDYPDEEVNASDVEIIGRVFWWAVMDA
ncbi:LexA family transcriptional regulator [Morganella morganii]|uniref:LexA family transcriptional regulator n=1 Tax=Morganella morganii TaxID=582 RepID=UPI001CEC6642|nr:helix-turn-helix transcriptional regulator [Morganella morganii]MCT1587261.1 helix-turn-helix transcriptional regulator [Morganella morganii]